MPVQKAAACRPMVGQVTDGWIQDPFTWVTDPEAALTAYPAQFRLVIEFPVLAPTNFAGRRYKEPAPALVA